MKYIFQIWCNSSSAPLNLKNQRLKFSKQMILIMTFGFIQRHDMLILGKILKN